MAETNPNDPRDIDLSFCPLDDISYHNEKTKPNAIRCVLVLPYNRARTIYLTERSYGALCVALDVPSSSTIDKTKSEDIQYISNGIPKTITAIYSVHDDCQQPCVLVEGKPVIIADSCLLTGEDFTDLSMEQCFALVSSARARCIDGAYGVCVNITKDMDLIPRVIYDD